MKLICALLLFVLAVSGQTVTNQTSSSTEITKWSVLDRLFGFVNNEVKPELEKYISMGRDLVEDWGIEMKGEEIVETAKNFHSFVNKTSKTILAELQLEKYFKLFQEKLEDAERIATEIRAQVKKFFTILHEKSHQLKDHLPTNLTMLTEVSKQLQTRVQLLQEKMEELQTKANKAYQDGQEIVLKNMEAQLEMVREQLKAAKEQTKILKTQIESYLSKWKLTGEELGENAKQQWEKMIEMAKLSFGKAKDYYVSAKQNLDDMIEKSMAKFEGIKESAQDHMKNIKKTVLDHVETLKSKTMDWKNMKDKVTDYMQTAEDAGTVVVDKISELTPDIRQNEHVNTVLEKATDLKETLQTKIHQQADKMKQTLGDWMTQYKAAMAKASSMQKDAEANLRRVISQMSNGSQVMFEKAKGIATENLEIAKGYASKMHDMFEQQLERFALGDTDSVTPTTAPNSSLNSRKAKYLRMKKKLRSMLPTTDSS